MGGVTAQVPAGARTQLGAGYSGVLPQAEQSHRRSTASLAKAGTFQDGLGLNERS